MTAEYEYMYMSTLFDSATEDAKSIMTGMLNGAKNMISGKDKKEKDNNPSPVEKDSDNKVYADVAHFIGSVLRKLTKLLLGLAEKSDRIGNYVEGNDEETKGKSAFKAIFKIVTSKYSGEIEKAAQAENEAVKTMVETTIAAEKAAASQTPVKPSEEKPEGGGESEEKTKLQEVVGAEAKKASEIKETAVDAVKTIAEGAGEIAKEVSEKIGQTVTEKEVMQVTSRAIKEKTDPGNAKKVRVCAKSIDKHSETISKTGDKRGAGMLGKVMGGLGSAVNTCIDGGIRFVESVASADAHNEAMKKGKVRKRR